MEEVEEEVEKKMAKSTDYDVSSFALDQKLSNIAISAFYSSNLLRFTVPTVL